MPNAEAIELMNQVYSRRKLGFEYRSHFFGVIRLFGPTMYTVISNRHKQREARLAAGVEEAIAAQIKEKGPQANRERITFKTQLELYSILCLEYRELYFTAIRLIGEDTFNYVEDFHRQRDAVGEAEGTRLENMLKGIRHAAD